MIRVEFEATVPEWLSKLKQGDTVYTRRPDMRRAPEPFEFEGLYIGEECASGVGAYLLIHGERKRLDSFWLERPATVEVHYLYGDNSGTVEVFYYSCEPVRDVLTRAEVIVKRMYPGIITCKSTFSLNPIEEVQSEVHND